MLDWLTEPFASDVVLRALFAGVVAAGLCAVVGTWVVLRGAAFLGDAMSHGVLPGVAVASMLGGNIFVGAIVAALAMAYGVAALGGSRRLSADTHTGLLLVGMLAAGVIAVSHSQSYAVDLTGFLFGDVLAVRSGDIAVLATALALTTAAAFVGRRAFIAASFDPCKAATLGLRPDLAAAAITVLIAVAIVASFRVVGTLLVFGLLIAPPAAAALWATTIPQITTAAAAIGAVAVGLGLVISWHAGTAGGATIAAVAVGIFFCSLAATALKRHAAKTTVLLVSATCVAGCSGAGEEPAASSTAPSLDDEVPPAGVEESAEPVTRLVVVDPISGETSVFDVLDETETGIGRFGAIEKLSGDGRFGYLHGRGELSVVDAGSWTFDHGDHNHHYLTAPAVAGTVHVEAVSVTADRDTTVVRTRDGRVELVDREQLGNREIVSPKAGFKSQGDVAHAAPFRDRLLVVTDAGRLQAIDEHGTVRTLPADCPAATAPAVTRRAVIFGCANGAVKIGVNETEPAATLIPFSAGRPAAALGQLQHRTGSDVLVGIAGDDVWVLDTRRRTWSTVPVPGAVAVSTGDDGEILTLTRDGVLHSIDSSTGAATSSVPLFADGVPTDGPPPVVEVDSDRAYINNADAHEIYEVDYADVLRIARTLKTVVAPGLMVQAGR